MSTTTTLTENEIWALADEIALRKLKFADVKDGYYEMLSQEELEVVVAAIHSWAAHT